MKKIKFLFKPLLIFFFFIVAGLIIAYFLDMNIKKRFFLEIEKTSNVSIAAINSERVRNLSSIMPEDITSSPDYARLSYQVAKLGKNFSLNGIDAIYIITKKGDKIYFITDSTPSDQSGYVTPGILYKNPPKELYNVFYHGIAMDTEVYKDEYGQYLSRFSPISDSFSGELVGVLGVDVDYSFFQKSYYQQMFVFSAIWLLICAFVIFLYLYFRGINKLNTESRVSSEKINAISNSVNDLIVVIDNKSSVSFFNKTGEEMFGSSVDKLLGTKISDLIDFEDVFDFEVEKEIDNFSFSFDNSLSDKTFELKMAINKKKLGYYEAYFRVVEVNGENYLVGVFHNISKRKNIEIEIEKQKSDLEKVNQLMIGRELKMIELKKEIEDLKNRPNFTKS